MQISESNLAPKLLLLDYITSLPGRSYELRVSFPSRVSLRRASFHEAVAVPANV